MKVLKKHLMLMMVLLVGYVGFAQAQNISELIGTVTRLYCFCSSAKH